MPTFEFIITGHCGWAQERKCMLFFTWALKALANTNCMNSSKLFSHIDQDNENQFSPWSILMRFCFFQSTFFFVFFHLNYQFCQHLGVLAIKSIRASQFLWKWEFFKSIAIIANFSINQKNSNITIRCQNSYDNVTQSMHLCQPEC